MKEGLASGRQGDAVGGFSRGPGDRGGRPGWRTGTGTERRRRASLDLTAE